jgi:hypothetical protein
MTDQPPSPREVIAQWHLTCVHSNPDLAADELLESLRSRGYVVVPREPTQVMKDAGVSPEGRSEYGWPLDDYLYHEVFLMRPDVKADAAGLIYGAMIDAANPGGGGKG